MPSGRSTDYDPGGSTVRQVRHAAIDHQAPVGPDRIPRRGNELDVATNVSAERPQPILRSPAAASRAYMLQCHPATAFDGFASSP